jgi:regulator of nucleoside diphosphate kinase
LSRKTIFESRNDYFFDESTNSLAPSSNLDDLRNELKHAEVVDVNGVPSDAVTMNSTVRLRDPTTGEPAIYTLVYPDEADIRRNRLSILAPIGTAIFGFRVGDEVRWPTPNGWRKKNPSRIGPAPA